MQKLRTFVVVSCEWARDCLRWLAEGKVVYVGIAMVLLTVALPVWVWVCSETVFRLAGLWLQLLGVVIAIMGLMDVRNHFGHPLLKDIVAWLKRFPRWRRSAVLKVATGEIVMVGELVRLRVWTPDDLERPIEDRVAGIVKNQGWIRDELREHGRSLEDLNRSVKEQRRDFEGALEKVEERVRADLESLHTSNFGMAFLGLFCVGVGVFISTMAPELSELGKSIQCRLW